MSYEINDRTLIEEMCGDIRNTAQAEYEKLKERLKQEGRDLPGDFAFPLKAISENRPVYLDIDQVAAIVRKYSDE